MFRAECRSGSRLGRRVRAILAQGGLIGDEVANAMVAGRIAESHCADGFLLDGYPRTVSQARFFMRLLEQNGLPAPLLIHLEVPEEALVERIMARRQCPQCLRIYNALSRSEERDGLCDNDGSPLHTREDDCEEAIRERMRVYQEQTGPVAE